MEIYDIYLATHLSFLVNGQRVDYTQFSQNQCLPSKLYMLSAQNPMDEPLSDNQNQQRHHTLLALAQKDAVFFAQGWGQLDDYQENMLLVNNADKAMMYAANFGHRAIFVLYIDDNVKQVQSVADGVIQRQSSYIF